MSSIRFTSDRYKNTHLEVIDSQLWLKVSLNISRDLIKFLSKGNVFKAKELYVFTVSARILGQISTLKIDSAYRNCMQQAMIKTREAKVRSLHHQINSIPKVNQLVLSFNN